MYLLDGGDEVDDGLLGWLSELNVEQLSRVLENRPDALDPPWPRRLDDLARRLCTQPSVVRATHDIPAPAMQVLRAAQLALLGTILTQWWNLTAAPLADPKALRDLLGDEPSGAYIHVRRLTVRLLTELDSDTGIVDPAAINDLIAWHAPTITPELIPALVAAVWGEAELLGVITAGAATDLAHALLGDAAELVKATQQVISRARTTVLFGSDLTAIVAGSPDAQLAAVLDRAAEREAQGAATTWRFSPASVRRALDPGQTAVELLDELSSVAEGELPQPLRYLIGDVGRRHGGVGMIEVRCVVIGKPRRCSPRSPRTASSPNSACAPWLRRC